MGIGKLIMTDIKKHQIWWEVKLLGQPTSDGRSSVIAVLYSSRGLVVVVVAAVVIIV